MGVYLCRYTSVLPSCGTEKQLSQRRKYHVVGFALSIRFERKEILRASKEVLSR